MEKEDNNSASKIIDFFKGNENSNREETNLVDLTMDENNSTNEEMERIQRRTPIESGIIKATLNQASQKAIMLIESEGTSKHGYANYPHTIEASDETKRPIHEYDFMGMSSGENPIIQYDFTGLLSVNPRVSIPDLSLTLSPTNMNRNNAEEIFGLDLSLSSGVLVAHQNPGEAASSSIVMRNLEEDPITVFSEYLKKLAIPIVVKTDGGNPNGPTIYGFLHKFDPREMLIMCDCHKSVFTPRGFVVHGGGAVDAPNPNILIKVVGKW